MGLVSGDARMVEHLGGTGCGRLSVIDASLSPLCCVVGFYAANQRATSEIWKVEETAEPLPFGATVGRRVGRCRQEVCSSLRAHPDTSPPWGLWGLLGPGTSWGRTASRRLGGLCFPRGVCTSAWRRSDEAECEKG